MKTLLLDANVLLALAWPNHPFHKRATARLTQRGNYRWATCLLTQAAFVRISSNPTAIPDAKSPAQAGQMLVALISDKDHVYLEARKRQLPRLMNLLQRCHGHNQVNDAVLVWLAESWNATLLTFDAPLRHFSSADGSVELVG